MAVKSATHLCMPQPICQHHNKLLSRPSSDISFGIKLTIALVCINSFGFTFCTPPKTFPHFIFLTFHNYAPNAENNNQNATKLKTSGFQ
jgi:hypothetical protein